MTTDIQLVVFDLAGTTVRDDGQVPRAFVAALAERDIHVTADGVNRVRGSSKRDAIRRFFPDTPDREQLSASAYTSFRDHLARLYRTDAVQPIDGAEHVFRWLKHRGIRVALNTGFDGDITRLLLHALKWDDVADAVVCGDDVKAGRPAPDMILRAMQIAGVENTRNVANVGDTMVDLQAGLNASVAWNIGVLSGAHDRSQLEQAPHTYLCDSIRDLPALWDGWVP